jgi:dihydrofolate reductase
MRNLALVVHVSLDGFVAGVKGEFDGFDADAALFGRVSYQLLNDSWPAAKDRLGATQAEITYSNWYNSAEKIVISKTLKNKNLNNTTIISDNVETKIKMLKEQPGKNILIFGSPSISRLLMQPGLIDVYWIFVNPVIFGKGIPLFAELQDKIKLQLLATQQFSNGEIALKYSSDLK